MNKANENFLDSSVHDKRDPNPWLALYLDNSIPIHPQAKEALLRNNNSKSVHYLLPLIRFWSKVTMFFIHIFKYFFPNLINSSKILHQLLAWGLKNFVSAEANTLIFRHFHAGSEILEFIAKNIDGVEVPLSPLKPKSFEDIKDDLFLNHDLNLYNFVINLNRELLHNNIQIVPKSDLNLEMISEKFDMIEFPRKWTNILDLRSAIEVFTPVYQLFLTNNDFRRATNSLQLDETIGIYSAKILNSPAHTGLINNRHPMIPDPTFSAAHRLVLHGLASENLHAVLLSIKQGKPVDGVIITA